MTRSPGCTIATHTNQKVGWRFSNTTCKCRLQVLFVPSSCKFMFVDPKLQFVSKYFTSTCKSAGSWSNLASKLKGSHTCLSVVPIIFPFLVNFWLRQELKESQSTSVHSFGSSWSRAVNLHHSSSDLQANLNVH